MTLHPADAVKNVARKLGLVFNAGHVAAEHSYPFYAYDMRDDARAPVRRALAAAAAWPRSGSHSAAIRPPTVTDYLIWVAFVPIYALSVAMYVVAERYRLPLLVPLCIGAGAVVDSLSRFVRQGLGVSRAGAWRSRRRGHRGARCRDQPSALADDGRAEERTRWRKR